MDELRYWLALLRAPSIGPVTFFELLEVHPEPSQLFHSPIPHSLSQPLRDYLGKPDWGGVESDLNWASAAGCHIISCRDPRYPPLLQQLADRPPLLFVQGDLGLLASPQLAIVGSRSPTTVGHDTARDFAHHLAGVGLTITSGLALGIDAASHRGAIESGGATLAVTATGPDRIYPARNRDLAHAIIDSGGTLVTEFPTATPPLPGHFPRRNRLISGLSLGTLVVEAALRSGSLITARLASEQGREVFAIPGSIHNPLARGCHALIRQGAKLVERADDILEELSPQLQAILAGGNAGEPAAATPPTLDNEYRHLISMLGDEPTAVDTLVVRSGLTAAEVSSMLLQLELQGLVGSVPGGYMRTRNTSIR